MLRTFASPTGCVCCMAALAGMAAVSGYTCVVLILLTRHLTSSPPVQTLPLHFDYSSPADATATVDLGLLLVPFPRPFSLQEYLYPSARATPRNLSRSSPSQPQEQQRQQPSTPVCALEEQEDKHAYPMQRSLGPALQERLLASGQRVRVSVRLRLPPRHKDLFQLSGQLLAASGGVLQRAVRTHMMRDRPLLHRLLRKAVLAPCTVVGWCSDAVSVTFVLFDSFVEQHQAPLQAFRAQLASRQSVAGTLPPPAIFEAELKIELHMGTVRWLLYWLRPSLPVTLVLTSLASLLALTGSALSLLLALLCIVMRALAQPPQAAAPGVAAAAAAVPIVPLAAVATPTRLSFPGLLSPARGWRGQGGSSGGGGADAPDLLDPLSDDADLQWQVVEDEEYHEVDEGWT